MLGISLLGSFFTFNRKFLTETKRSSKLVPSKVFLMWVRQEENKKSLASYSTSVPLHKPNIFEASSNSSIYGSTSVSLIGDTRLDFK